MNKHLLILGGGIMQIPVIKIAQSLGIKTLVFDGAEDPPGRNLADYFTRVDISQGPACVQAALDHRNRFRLDGVMTVGTDFSTTVAQVAETLGLPGIPYETALGAKDKGLMRQKLAQAGVPVPWFHILEKNDPLPALNLESFPLVVKPSDNMGARGVRLVQDPKDLTAAVAEARGFSHQGKILLEGFMDGKEYSLDAIVRDGEIRLTGIADRHIFYPPWFIELGHSFPCQAPAPEQRALIDTFEKGIRALGINHGAAKGDIKMTSKGPMVGEIAARLSGGFMSGWTYPMTSGRSSILWALENALGQDLSDQGPETQIPTAEGALISPPGLLKEIQGLDEAKSIPGVKEIFLLTEVGRRVKFPTSNVEKCLNILVQGSSLQNTQEILGQALQKILLRLEPWDPQTEEFFARSQDPREWILLPDTQKTPWGIPFDQIKEDFQRRSGYSGPLTGELELFLRKGGLAGGFYWWDTRGPGKK